MASSPAPSASGDQSQLQGQKPLEQITFRFCSECSNMLYPKEDEADRKLMFTCRTCNFSEEATSSCIFRNVLNNAAGETAGVTQDVGSDPTVGESSVAPHHASLSEHRNSDHCAFVCCLTCGRMISCEICEDRLAVLPADAPNPDFAVPLNNFSQLDQGDADVCAWQDDHGDLANFMARSEHYFGDLMDENEEEAMGFEPENNSMSQYALAQSALPREQHTCPSCNHQEAVFFQSQQRNAETGMKLFYVCCYCGNIYQ
ncbi:hypothetical protein QBC40DRAFT_184363 [Triangularia verruculosa]|uniref:DNA-directed RNA polymerase II subunit RPB9 n=1 Tax=Triangularia verruculosa TaxID=2587418 RepID=A0AAN6X9P1_9PEZI|nr:hypothetical protein QBC40DRAFT_184363 [Triangularia verruculosa]